MLETPVVTETCIGIFMIIEDPMQQPNLVIEH